MRHVQPLLYLKRHAGPQPYVCSVGGRTPVGFSVRASAAAVRAGISAIAARQNLTDRAGEPISLACDPALALDIPISTRIARMLVASIQEAVAGLESSSLADLNGYFVGLPEPRPGLPPELGAEIRDTLVREFKCSPENVHLVPQGHASGLMAVQLAAQQISDGKLGGCVVAGADSYVHPDTLAWLDRHGGFMSASNRNGFPPGEAAGACVIGSQTFAARCSLPLRAEIEAAATAIETNIPGSGKVCVGDGLSTALREVFAALQSPREQITATYCDINGQRHRNEEMVYTLLRTQEAFVDANEYQCPADCWGDVGAASGPLFISLALCADERGYSSGNLPLIWAASENGYRTALLLRLGS